MNNTNKIYLSNIFIIDWDDTLFPTYWVNTNNIELTNKLSVDSYKLFFLELDKTIYKFLNKLNDIGDIYIVTNANIKWIKICLMVLNDTQNLIIKNNIRLVSARDMYSSNKNLNPTEWKTYTFQNILNNILNDFEDNNNYDNNYLNIISFGDANYEYFALINLDSFFKNKDIEINYLLKSVKFIEKPEFNSIIEEIQIVELNLKLILDKISYVDVKFTK
jgi:hypothetical protein